MFLKLPEIFSASKSLKMSDFHSLSSFNLCSDVLPRRLRDSLMSQDSSLMTLTVQDETSVEVMLRNERFSFASNRTLSSSKVLMVREDENEGESYEMARMCPSDDCNCGKCPLTDANSSANSISVVSFESNFSTMSLPEANFLSIDYVVPLRNYGAIIRWNVQYQHGVGGYKLFIDGAQVSSVHSPSRMSALVESVNMKIPHHFAVSIIPSAREKMPKIPYRNMHAVYLYKPTNFIH